MTLVEIVVVLAVLASVAAGAVLAFRPSQAKVDAATYATALRSSRLAALGSHPIAVAWNAERGRFETILEDDRCLRPPSVTWQPSPGTSVTRASVAGVVWLPDGTGRTCRGAGVYGGRVRFEDRRGTAWDVVVASSGRIRIERVP